MNQPSEISPIAAHVIRKCGGVARTAELTDRSEATVYKWRQAKTAGGTGGLIPADAQQRLIAAARAGIVPLDPIDFFEPGEATPTPAR